MSKYDILWKYIFANSPAELTFSEIYNILGFEIDHSFLKYKKELLDYGFEIYKISIKDKKIIIKHNNNTLKEI